MEIIPNENYGAGGFYTFLFGDHWRELWTIPVKAKILDLKKFAGGLEPIKKGGGQQTKSLRFIGNDGNYWKFRSIDKDPTKILPEALRTTFVAELLKDQITSANPLAPFIVAPILNEVEILQAEPHLVFLPDTELLGKFRGEFSDMLGIIEIHPDVEEDEGIEFKDALKVKGTFKLLNRLGDKTDEFFDATAYLKARLVDVFLGDWDRHTDQWRWAKYEENGREVWKPIPRDRDQAFAKFDGVFPKIAAYLVPQLNHFDYDYPQTEDLTWSGRFLDRRILSVITKPEWDSVTNFVVSKLTDSLINYSVKKLPPLHFEIASNELIGKLKTRREKLTVFSNEYFEIINDVAEIYTSEKDDFIEVNRLGDDFTEVITYRREKNEPRPKGNKIFYRKFENKYTNEIRIFLEDGDDYAIVRGESGESPTIRIIAGDGADELVDSSLVNGYLLGFIPIPSSETSTIFYDSGKKTKLIGGFSTEWINLKYPKPKDEFEKYEPQLRQRGHDWFYYPSLSYSTNDGIILGSAINFTKYNFRIDPYHYKISLFARYASIPDDYEIELNSIFHSETTNFEYHLDIIKTELYYTRYHGYGNETSFSDHYEDNDFYRLNLEKLSVKAGLFYRIDNVFLGGISFEYSYNEAKMAHRSLFSLPNESLGWDGIKSFNTKLKLTYDTRDIESYAKEGELIDFALGYFPKFLDLQNYFIQGSFDIRKFITPQDIKEITFALRAGGTKNWGSSPFFLNSFLGGKENLRGYFGERFSGEASLFGQFELRVFLMKAKIILPADVSAIGFVETGRVFADAESSDKWHPSSGGGISLSFLDRKVNLSLITAFSNEEPQVYFSSRMGF
ncbi:MAG: outer membrane protein assembly factor [Melioribacteraceae bacterium]|nr:outer membrane protein assembly factor [Melioribacteraceae bacterium]MCF8264704.1 outer membrane protein assembly factor [Melioribacteraceae bacterium]